VPLLRATAGAALARRRAPLRARRRVRLDCWIASSWARRLAVCYAGAESARELSATACAIRRKEGVVPAQEFRSRSTRMVRRGAGRGPGISDARWPPGRRNDRSKAVPGRKHAISTARARQPAGRFRPVGWPRRTGNIRRPPGWWALTGLRHRQAQDRRCR
jgi:hypothetical protein